MSEAGCGAILQVDTELRAILDRLPGEVYQIEDEYTCDLQLAEHEELHHAVAQGAEDSDSGTEIWIHWGADSPPEVVELSDCDSELVEEFCVLFDGHSGRHTSGNNTWR